LLLLNATLASCPVDIPRDPLREQPLPLRHSPVRRNFPIQRLCLAELDCNHPTLQGSKQETGPPPALSGELPPTFYLPANFIASMPSLALFQC
jgi:hypothetical protein